MVPLHLTKDAGKIAVQGSLDLDSKLFSKDQIDSKINGWGSAVPEKQ
jgi:hypothetical protein